MRSVVVLCHCDGILKSEEEDHIYIGGERRVFLIDGDVPFDIFESQIRHTSDIGSSVLRSSAP